MIFGSIVFVLLALLAFKIVPVYIEYFAIERQFKAMAADPNLKGASRAQIANAWAARATVDNLQSIDPKNIEVTREGDGIVLSSEYSVRVPLFRNVAACFDFNPSSR